MDHDLTHDAPKDAAPARKRWIEPEMVEFDVDSVTADGPLDNPDGGITS